MMKYLSIFIGALIVGGCSTVVTNNHSEEPKEYRVVIPEETHAIVEFKQNNLPGVATINSALVEFEPKIVFAWHLSIMIEAKDLGENGMPTPDEQQILYKFEDEMDPIIKTNGNALFLARITNDGWRELVYRIYDPEPLDKYLKEVISSNKNLRPFDYRMEADETWEKAQWHINAVSP